jgi:3-oxoacyl-[acyl-carrier-protein] synthase II
VTARVAVTGIGLVSALGTTRDESWKNLVAGQCGIGPLTLFESEGYRSRIAAQVDDAALRARLTPLQRRRWSRSDQFAVLAAREAVADAGLGGTNAPAAGRVGVILGSSTGDLIRNERYVQASLDPAVRRRPRLTDAWNHFYSTSVDIIAAEFGFEGLRSCIVAACASSTMSVGMALDAIRFGRADAVLAGGTDSLARLTFSGFNALRVMDPAPCRPFDRTRSGMNIGEGAAVLVLEDMTLARRRGARIYAEVAGHSLTCEAFHPTSPEPDGRAIAATMSRALEDGRVPADLVQHVNAHGTATAHNDQAESRGIHLVFGRGAKRLPVTSVKSMIGHTLGASGGIEAAITALTVYHGVIPPTIHHGETDPQCEVDVVANDAREERIACAVSTSLAFGGNDAAVVFRAV